VVDEAASTGRPSRRTATSTQHEYWWRVRGTNTCGDGAWSAARSFTTLAAPGDCGPHVPVYHFQDDFESGAPADALRNRRLVALDSTPIVPPAPRHLVYHANDTSIVTDQRWFLRRSSCRPTGCRSPCSTRTTSRSRTPRAPPAGTPASSRSRPTAARRDQLQNACC